MIIIPYEMCLRGHGGFDWKHKEEEETEENNNKQIAKVEV